MSTHRARYTMLYFLSGSKTMAKKLALVTLADEVIASLKISKTQLTAAKQFVYSR